MNRHLLAGLFVIMLGVNLAVKGQEASSSVSPLGQSLAAITGEGQPPLKDIKLEGTVDYSAGTTHETGTIVLKAIAGGYSSAVVTLPSGTSKEVRSRATGVPAGIDGDEHGTRITSTRNLFVEPYWFSPELILADLSDPKEWTPLSLSAAQQGPSSDHPLHFKLQRNRETGAIATRAGAELSTTDIVLNSDAPTPRIMSHLRYPSSSRLRPISIWYRYEDYRNVNGHLVPFHIQRYINQSCNLDIHVETVSINSSIQTSEFSLQ